MKKVILSIALLSASALSVFAQSNTPVNAQQACVATEQCAVNAKAGKCNKAFEGLNLTDDQKAKIAALNQGKCTAAKDKPAKEDRKDGSKKEKPTKEQMQQKLAERAARHQEARKAYLVQVKEILSPDQYVMFLENSYTLQDINGPHKSKGFGARKMDKKLDSKGPHRMKPVTSQKSDGGNK